MQTKAMQCFYYFLNPTCDSVVISGNDSWDEVP